LFLLSRGKNATDKWSIETPFEEKQNDTAEIINEVGKILNMSPAKINFVLSSFGGVAQDTQNALDIVYNVVRDGKIGGNSISETPWGSVTQIPGVRRFVRESAERGYETQDRYEQKKEIATDIKTKKLEIYDKAEEIWQGLNKKKTKEDKLNYLNSFGDELTDDIKKRIKYLQTQRKSVESLKPSDSLELRARYIIQRLEEMKELDVSKEERILFLNDLENNKILNQNVKDLIYQLQHQ